MKIVVSVLLAGVVILPAVLASLLLAAAGEPQSYWLWCTVLKLCN